MTCPWCSPCESQGKRGIRLTILVTPNAKKTEVVGPLDASLKIRLQAQPIEGRANAALIRFLAELLGVPRTAVLVTHGLNGKRKRIEVQAPQLTVAAAMSMLCNG